MTCPYCTAALPDDDIFCEECGQRLSDVPEKPAPVCSCGISEADLDEDGYCTQCGRRCRPAPGDHEEKELSPDFAAVTDRGIHHHRNEDHFVIEDNAGSSVLVVCDGVSSSSRADEAAGGAARAITDALISGGGLSAAFAQAAKAVAELGAGCNQETAPSVCAVATIVSGGYAHIGWIGDSRAYWISLDDSRQLTNDHSWLNEVVSSGELSAEQAAKSPRAHGVTHWIGAEAGSESEPEFTTFEIPGSGWLLFCTDGLWNYASEMSTLAEKVLAFPAETPALAIAQSLIRFANESGGHDNVTVALLRFPS